MDILKNKEFLEYYGIYTKKELTQKEIDKYKKLKKQIEKLIEEPLEKMFLIGPKAWGQAPNEDEKYNKEIFLIAIDKRFKDLDREEEILTKFSEENNIGFKIASLCRYEKRKKILTEEEYFIENYGIKIHDSGKEPSINESIGETEYAAFLKATKRVRAYLGKDLPVMESYVRIYILKLGFPVRTFRPNFEIEVKIANMISNDEEAKKLINQYVQEEDKKVKKEIENKFEKILNSTKQVRYDAKLENKPTMQVYEKLLEEKKQKGKLDIKTLTKEDLYTMYVIQNKHTYELCELYDVTRDKIDSKRTYYGIKMNEVLKLSQHMEDRIKLAEGETKDYGYAIFRDNFDFERCIKPILQYMRDGETYLLREFWKFVSKNENSMLESYDKKITQSYYKAELAADLLVQNELIDEVDYKQYKITKKGKSFIDEILDNPDITDITIPVMVDYIDDFKYYDLNYEPGDPTNLQELFAHHANMIREEYEQQIECKAEEHFKKLTVIENEVKVKKAPKKQDTTKARKPRKIDFEKINREKKNIGDFCEEMVLLKEKEMLIEEGRQDLADNVVWLSKEIGDGAGYDIESFRKFEDKYEKVYIEVKGTNKNQIDHFYVTLNEIVASLKYKDKYYICQITNAKKNNPGIKYTQGEIEGNFELSPIQFEANPKI